MRSIIETIKESKKDQYYVKRPLVDTYNGYEIRKYKDLYVVDVSIGVLGFTAETIEDCKEFIDMMVKHGIEQGDGEGAMKYIQNKKRKC